MKVTDNEKGVTLIEVLLAMAILSIILISIMNIFPQMGMMNKQNEDKAQAINIAKEILINWKDSPEVQTFIADKTRTAGFTITDPKIAYHEFNKDADYYYFKTSKEGYEIVIKIKKEPKKQSVRSFIHPITIQVMNKKGSVVSETYGFVKR